MVKNSDDTIHVNVNSGRATVDLKAREGELLLAVLQRNGILVQASCGGKGSCKKCRVVLDNNETILACQYTINQNLELYIPDLHDYVILDQLNPHARVLRNHSGIAFIDNGGKRGVTFKGVLLHEKDDPDDTEAFGVALDIGTTTMAFYLVNLMTYELIEKISVLNPQGNYGADVISRIEYGIREEEGVSVLQKEVITGINKAVRTVCRKAGLRTEQIYLMTVVGNTVMLHLLLGVNPSPIAFAPYTPVFTEQKMLRGTELGLQIHPAAHIRILPSIAGYVGADIIAGIAATDIMDKEHYTLYIDIGTNGEIALGNRDVLYCCATAAGPAFEGARIECGVGGVQGAISEYVEGRYETIGHKKAVGICGSGLIDIIAFMLDTGVIDFSGILDADFVVEKKDATATDHDIVITQKDIRELQLAKSAIYAGIQTLMGVAGVSFDAIDAVYLAGGFGNYIRSDSAVRIGLLPAELKDNIIPVGNSAGTGALLSLKSLDFEPEVDRVLARAEYVELSMRPDFNDLFMNSMFFPEH